MATTTERPLADALTAIKTRRSVKEYVPTEIPREWIEELLDAAHWAPNHKLTHPWRFHVFSDGDASDWSEPDRRRCVGPRRKRVSRRAKRPSASLVPSVIRPQSSSSFRWWAMRTKSLTRRTSRPAGARFRTCWLRRPREVWAAIPARALGSTKTSLAQFSDSQRKSGRWHAFSWGTPSRRLWPSACPWSAIPPGTPRPETRRGQVDF